MQANARRGHKQARTEAAAAIGTALAVAIWATIDLVGKSSRIARCHPENVRLVAWKEGRCNG
jgi:hypothetical protein